MTLHRVINLRFVDNFNLDSIILNDERKIIYVVIIVETSRKEKRSLREIINVIFRKIVFKTLSMSKQREQKSFEINN
jgi:hypothetical protein